MGQPGIKCYNLFSPSESTQNSAVYYYFYCYYYFNNNNNFIYIGFF